MSPESIPVSHVSSPECRTCAAGAPVDEHFCPQCSRILALGRHGDYFTFLGLPRKLTIVRADLERRFRDLSRQFHPDYYYNASPTERLASLERSSYLNDAYRTLSDQASRIEHLLAVEGRQATGADQGTKVPPGLLEEVFSLNEELDEIRELREAGKSPEALRDRLRVARQPIDAKHEAHERELESLCTEWDRAVDAGDQAGKQEALDALGERLLERNYINNLLATIERELERLGGGAGPAGPSGIHG